MSNSYTKLKSGDWGIRVTGKDLENLRPGKIVQVGTKEGTKSEKTIKGIVQTYDDAVICSFFEEHEQFASYRVQDEYIESLREKKNTVEPIIP